MTWRETATSLYNRLLSCKCWCLRSYDMQVTLRCARCKGVADYEEALKQLSTTESEGV